MVSPFRSCLSIYNQGHEQGNLYIQEWMNDKFGNTIIFFSNEELLEAFDSFLCMPSPDLLTYIFLLIEKSK